MKSESTGDARTRSLRRDQLQGSPPPASPSASQMLRAVEQDSPPASQMLGSGERGDPDSPIPELNAQMMTKASRPYSSSSSRCCWSWLPDAKGSHDRLFVNGWSMDPAGWRELSAQATNSKARVRDTDVRMKLTELEKREALLQLREAELKVKEVQMLKATAMEVETGRVKKATAAPAKSKPAKAAGPAIKSEPGAASSGSRSSVLWSGPTLGLPEPDAAVGILQCFSVWWWHPDM